MEKSGIHGRPAYEFGNNIAAPSATEIDELADRCQSLEQRIASLNDSYETLKKREVELTEWRWVLREAGGFFDRVGGDNPPFYSGHGLTPSSGTRADGGNQKLHGERRRAPTP